MNSAPQSTPSATPCWICAGPANTAEHKLKRSDVKANFGAPTQQRPLYLHTHGHRNQRVQTLRSPLLSFKNPLCGKCNNERTQAHDRAWEKLAANLAARRRELRQGAIVRTSRIWAIDTRRHMRAMHLYFVKLFLGSLVDGDVAGFDRMIFQRAILGDKPHPNVYLKFGLFNGGDGRVIAGSSDLEVQYYAGGDRPAFAAWRYEPGSGVAVMVMFADGERRDGLDGAWHPKQGTTRLIMADFND